MNPGVVFFDIKDLKDDVNIDRNLLECSYGSPERTDAFRSGRRQLEIETVRCLELRMALKRRLNPSSLLSLHSRLRIPDPLKEGGGCSARSH